ncbi:transcription factor GTE9-like isoform X1 [Zingiber officinale]|uniref:transcription factor GTE9-like isoform X1 n=1 Tax=Zingiber officinale TaxID=94328 RepID=UPI001C4C7DE8|nr:transcription factor GTE9-like isoform X1 [Zingiber officinale]XP_042437373.1 transcription factor GTE9-like isoform X1 [Zingiber officinale]XP_042437374.1 transcription factor GTE9-like isoform X1 [Zingiber officinale]XP_042437375.1 transcription factor GTE9-like isoform X1 [Zingiber officinale]
MVPEKSDTRSAITGVSKGAALGIWDAKDEGTCEKMDSTKTRECAITLKALMNHPVGWVFNQPVDPVKLKIPDYFSIISKPMDLGTIKHRLGSKQYLSTSQFAADVRLTFSNAMRYNPPGNEVHIMAKKLNKMFNVKWKLLEAKWKKESMGIPLSVTSIMERKQDLQKRSSTFSFLKRTMTSAEKLKLKKEISKLSVKEVPPRLLTLLRSKHIIKQVRDLGEVDVDLFDEGTLWELYQATKSCFDATEMKKCAGRPPQDSYKGTHDAVPQANLVDKPMSPSACKRCVNRPTCNPCNHFSRPSSSELGSERPSGGHFFPHSPTYDVDCRRTSIGVGLRKKDTVHSHPLPLTTPADIGFPYEEQWSPSKALRAASLRSRFADTILKAQHQSFGEKVDPVKLQQEREEIEKLQQQEKARIKAKIKAAEFAAKMKAEAKVKSQREAARLALQKMEKTVQIDNSHLLQDLENFGWYLPCLSDMPHEKSYNFVLDREVPPPCHSNPLEQLGLFMKKDDIDEVDDWISETAIADVEEGEIYFG